MEYDDIDNFVDQLFNKPEGGDDKGEVLSGDWRIDRIDQIIQDTYDEAIWLHNQRISEGTDPRSGLRSLPYIPWDERIDGVAAMMGAAGGVGESSFERNGGHWRRQGTQAGTMPQTKGGGLSCAEVALTGILFVLGLAACGLLAIIFDWVQVYGV